MQVLRVAIQAGHAHLVVKIWMISRKTLFIAVPIIAHAGTMTGGTHVFFAGSANELVAEAYPLVLKTAAGRIGTADMALTTGRVTTGAVLGEAFLDTTGTFFKCVDAKPFGDICFIAPEGVVHAGLVGVNDIGVTLGATAAVIGFDGGIAYHIGMGHSIGGGIILGIHR